MGFLRISPVAFAGLLFANVAFAAASLKDQKPFLKQYCYSCHGAEKQKGDLRFDNLGTDLTDDHPISFPYDPHLAIRDERLMHPRSLHPSLRLDAGGELQCTTCHDPHDDTYSDFLIESNAGSQLCGRCHLK